ncbi:hypothetical protein [Embleya sp. NBC_00896]|uniref:hypothetical protein n=1 Tax=Embleya sp. NBC_00896 TaxID=2975961 RepID=UPI002F913BE2|nr:hypothetical protein OG928_47220 [Embleya sp. NBC_00896]
MTDPPPSVVVVAAETDLTADLVVTRLLDGHATVLRLDPGRLRDDIDITGEFRTGHWQSVLRHGGRTAVLGEHCSVYWRKPTRPDAHDDADQRWRADENTTALLGLLRTHPLKVWCNDPTTTARAALKPAQLAAAAAAGLSVPDTLLTSDPAAARAFLRAHDDRVVVKTQTKRHTAFVPTTRLRLADDLDRVAGTVHYLQALVADRLLDARVTVVDDTAFGAAITTDGELDWRTAPPGTCRYAPLTVPDDIARACVAHVRALGLAYAALDFVVTPQGWWYIETNPNGEFGFVQAHTGLPVAERIADLLLHGPSSGSSASAGLARARM